MKSLLLFICRIIPALVFIFSGFVKAIDPVGGAVKFEDYFTAFGMEGLSPLALPLSMALASLEFVIGFFLLCKLYMRFSSSIVLIITAFFTVLTFFLAIFNPVSDCGCFGDAIKLTNWETFGKNIVLLLFTIVLFKYSGSYRNNYHFINNLTAAALSILFIIGFNIHNYRHLPVIDFRPYKIGTNIPDNMRVPEGAEMPEFETVFVLEKEGAQHTFSVDDYPYDDTSWVFVESRTKIVKEGFVPPLQAFSLYSPEHDDEVHSEVLNRPGPTFLLIAPLLEKMPHKVILPLAELSETARQKDLPFYVVTSSGTEEIKAFDNEHATMFNYLQSDKTTLKTIIRSNPGLLLLQDGTIAGKWHYNDMPEASIMNNPLANALEQQRHKRNNLVRWLSIAGLLLIPSLIFRSKTTK